jgi:hypothetical protein
MPDLKPGFAAVTKLQAKFVAGVDGRKNDLLELQHECRVLLSLIVQCLDDLAAADIGNQVDWLDPYPLPAFNLTGYTQAQKDDFIKTQKIAFQKELDDSPYNGYRIIMFNLSEKPPGSNMFVPTAYLSPTAKPGQGGGGGAGTPGYPPK